MSESLLSFAYHKKFNSELFKEHLFTGRNNLYNIKNDLPLILNISNERYIDLIKNYKNDKSTYKYKSEISLHKHKGVCEPYFITPERASKIKELSQLCQITQPEKDYNPMSLQKWLDSIKPLVGIKNIKKYIVTDKANKKVLKKRKTCRAHFNIISHKKFTKTNKISKLNIYKNRIEAIKLISIIEGRMRYYYSSWINNKAHLIIKTGLTHFELNDYVNSKYGSWYDFIKKYPLTSMFMIFYLRETKKLKKPKFIHSFSQLHRSLTLIFAEIIKKESECMDVLAFMLPIEEVYSNITIEQSRLIYKKTMEWLGITANYIEKNWKMHKNLYKPWANGIKPSCKINITVFNTAINAWNKLRYFQVISAKYGKVENPPLLIKMMTLSLMKSKNRPTYKSDKYVTYLFSVFKDLLKSWQGKNRILPWHSVLYPDMFDEKLALREIIKSCIKHNNRVEPWISQFKDYYTTKKDDLINNIDGNYVPPMTNHCVEFLKSKIFSD